MAKTAYDDRFPGQQSDERVLYEVRPHKYSLYVKMTVVIAMALLVAFLSLLVGSLFSELIALFGIVLALAIGLFGGWAVMSQFNQYRAYITDRRVVRFEATTPFNVNTRSLNWDDTLKIKTFPPNVIWSMLNIGEVVLHARSSIISFTSHDQEIEKEITGDDLELKYVYYYKDLGNYLDKILYTYRHNPTEVKNIHPFVAKPRGQRY